MQTHPFITPLVIGALAGVFEELLFRGPIQTALSRKNSPWVAIIIGAVLFAAAHLDLHGMGLRAVMGIVLGWTVWRTGSIFPAMLIHGLYDAGTLGLSSWEVHHDAVEGAGPILDGWIALRLAIGLLLAACGWWLIWSLKRAPEPAVVVERGFEPVMAK